MASKGISKCKFEFYVMVVYPNHFFALPVCKHSGIEISNVDLNSRSWSCILTLTNFNKQEFGEELLNIDWPGIVNENNGTETSYQKFYTFEK